jgi:hypothetical protein
VIRSTLAVAVGLLLPLVGAVVAFFAVRPGARPALRVLRAAGLLCLGVVPVAVLESQGYLAAARGAAPEQILLAIGMGWWVLLGGWTARWVFEATVGPRQVTLGGDIPYFVLLVAAQTLVLAWLVVRHSKGREKKNLVAAAAVAFVVVNAYFVRTWTWWGS